MPNRRTNELLGYPPDARLLILNADDFGMYRAIDDAILRTLTAGVVRSTTWMAPCPAAEHALQILLENPAIAFGVHLTVISDRSAAPYAPLTPPDQVPSLVDPTGYFYGSDRIPEFLGRAKVDELELEFRAQIEAALAAGLAPTHLDWHCLHSGGRPDIFALTRGLARQYGLAVRVAQPPLSQQLQEQGLPTADYDLVDSFRIETVDKSARYVQMLRELPAGLTEWAVHPGLGTAEAQASDPGWPVRQADFEFLVSAEAHEVIRQEGIIVLGYAPLREVWRTR